MRKPKYKDCLDENDEFDAEEHAAAMGQYEDEQRDEYLERQAEEGDRIHERNRDEKDES